MEAATRVASRSWRGAVASIRSHASSTHPPSSCRRRNRIRHDAPHRLVTVKMLIDATSVLHLHRERALTRVRQLIQIAMRVAHDQAGAVQLFKPATGA